MRFCRFSVEDKLRAGVVEGDHVVEISGDGRSRCEGAPHRYRLNEVRLLPPCTPSKVVMVGLNYRDHAEETGASLPSEPCLFIKPDTAVIGPEDAIVLPDMSKQVDYEAELGIVIARTLHNANLDEARAGILGYTCVNDVTARDLQRKDGQWTRGKSFDTFCPVGPWIVDDVNPSDLEIEMLLNGERRQHSSTAQLIFKPVELVSFISHVMTLKPGDLIGTGTPSGIGPMKRGDQVEVRIAGIGTLRNTVA
jgi:2-keto-4-pentenoate hydratase/2-oxohepta-3-ene-1,7-dioic acid hydratase in catechol pathway